LNNLHKIIISLTFFFSFSLLFAQGFDEKFLTGLPKDVREDVLKELEVSQSSTEGSTVIERRPISKLKLEESQSERYGIDFFNSVQSSFMPINDPNINGDYILDFGDVLDVYYIGVLNQNLTMQISRDGSISLPKIGPVIISGLTLRQASSLIQAKIKASLTGVEGYITLSNLRDIQVLVTGESSYPGVYTLNGNSNLLHALNVSGGISENGSFRSIEIKRDGKTIKIVDLYDLIIFGNASFTHRLQSGDTIYVPPAKILARAGGGFNRTGIFEFKEGDTYKDLLTIVGGTSRAALSDNYLINTYNNGKFQTVDLNIVELLSREIVNDDSIYFEEYSIGTISLKGMVKFPGVYSITNNDTLSSIINRAGGYLDQAYTFGGQIYREKAKLLEKENNTNLYNDFIKYIVGSFNKGVIVDTTLPALLQELKNKEVSGRVRAEFNLNMIALNKELDTLLRDGDIIFIPKYDESIYVYGEVVSPGTTRYEYQNSLSDYVKFTGGLSPYADSSRIVVISPDGKPSIKSRNKLFNQQDSFDIYPGSVIYVPRDLNQVEGLRIAEVVAPIFSSLALSLASLSAIND